jgi:hypothetical protein
VDAYLQLLDWTGRQIRQDKAGNIPAECAPILERLQCSAETWLDDVQNFRKRFRNAAGLKPTLQSHRHRTTTSPPGDVESRNGWPQPLIPVMLSPTGWVAPMVLAV